MKLLGFDSGVPFLCLRTSCLMCALISVSSQAVASGGDSKSDSNSKLDFYSNIVYQPEPVLVWLPLLFGLRLLGMIKPPKVWIISFCNVL